MSFFFKTTEQLTVIDDKGGQRLTFTFSVEGLAAREELLFKGYVRLLDQMTEHHWHYCEASALQRVDLLVADENVQPTKFLLGADDPQPILLLGVNNFSSSRFFLEWPLKPYELENQLNRLGRLIKPSVVREQGPGEPKAKAESPHSSPAELHYRLRQWPNPMLLAQPGRMRLATLLTGKAMGLDELQFRSALPKALCERFLADMQAAGLIMHPGAADSQQPPLVAPSATPPRLSVQQERQADQPAAKPSIQPGLIARIRMRFGIKSPSAN